MGVYFIFTNCHMTHIWHKTSILPSKIRESQPCVSKLWQKGMVIVWDTALNTLMEDVVILPTVEKTWLNGWNFWRMKASVISEKCIRMVWLIQSKKHMQNISNNRKEQVGLMNTVSRKENNHGTYTLTKEDKEYIKSFAKDGVVSFSDYLKAMTTILNK